MWALRRASIPLRPQTFSTVAFRACCAKHETSGAFHMEKNGFCERPRQMSDGFLLKRFSSIPCGTHNSSRHAYSSLAGTESSGDENDLEDGFSELESSSADVAQASNTDDENDDDDDDDAVSEAGELFEEDETQNEPGKNDRKRRTSELFQAIMDSPAQPVHKALDKWLENGGNVTRTDIMVTMMALRRRRMYTKALQTSEWLETRKQVEFNEQDYASRVDLVSKVRGLGAAESYIARIPESFRGEIVYRTLLANCVVSNQVAKAEQIFNKMRDLKFPVTTFACNQLLLLYKRTDKKKIADVLLLMEKENVKPSPFTYGILIDTKGQFNDISGMEQIVETMKAEGVEPDLKIQSSLAKYYIYGRLKEKAKVVLKEMEGDDLRERRKACVALLPLYAALGSADDVRRVWEACGPNPLYAERISAIKAWGRLKKIEEAESVFDQTCKMRRPSSKHYTVMLQVYADNKLLDKGKTLVKQMAESGCRIGAWTWDALVKLYVGAGEVEKADSVLHKATQHSQMKPLFNTYLLILTQYAKRGDVHNAEKIFQRMRQDGYMSRQRLYHCLLEAYINAKAPAYGFRERMKADNIFPGRALASQLAQADAFKKTPMSDLLD